MEPISRTFNDIQGYVDFIVPFVRRNKIVITRLVEAITSHGIVLKDMPIFRYSLEHDLDDLGHITLNTIEFRGGSEYYFVSIHRVYNWVRSQHIELGDLNSITLDVTVMDNHDKYRDERCGEHEHKPYWL
jgi:hypothetical protein